MRRVLAILWVLLVVGCASPQVQGPEQPQLAGLAAPYEPQLRDLGISRVVSPGSYSMVRLETSWGAVYFPYPRDVPALAFELAVDDAGIRAVSSSVDVQRDQRVLAAILPIAMRETASNNELQWMLANPVN